MTPEYLKSFLLHNPKPIKNLDSFYDWMDPKKQRMTLKCPFGDVPIIQGMKAFSEHMFDKHQIKFNVYCCYLCVFTARDKSTLTEHFEQDHNMNVTSQIVDILQVHHVDTLRQRLRKRQKKWRLNQKLSYPLMEVSF